MERTCGNCKNLFLGGLPPRMPLMACKATDNIVPHEWDGKKFTLWRVPSFCPLADEVLKSEKQAPKSEWVIRWLSDFDSGNSGLLIK